MVITTTVLFCGTAVLSKKSNIIEWSKQTLDNVAQQEVTQREMMKIIGLFRKNGFRGEYETFDRGEVQDEYMVVLTDEKSGVKGLFKVDLGTGSIEFQHVVMD